MAQRSFSLSLLHILWWLLVLGALIFAAGISGFWLQQQFPEALAARYWGWFGALLAGGCVFGGVLLAQRGERIGWLVAAVGVGADVLMDVLFFAQMHNPFISVFLGSFPMLVAVLAGIIEGRYVAAQSKRQESYAEDAHKLEFERQRAEMELALREQKRRSDSEIRIKERQALMQVNQMQFMDGARVSFHKRETKTAGAHDAQFAAYVQAHPQATYREIIAGLGERISTAEITFWTRRSGWKKTPTGWVAPDRALEVAA